MGSGPDERRDHLRYVPRHPDRWDGHLSRLRRMEPVPPLPSRPRGLPPLGVRLWEPPPREVLLEVLDGLEDL